MAFGKHRRGYTLIELAVVFVVIAILSTIMMSRFNLYNARHSCKSIARILVSDIRLAQQKAYALERPQGITISPNGNAREYVVWASEPGSLQRRLEFDKSFPGDVYFASGQTELQLIFYPYTSGDTSGNPILSEWSVVKKNTVDRIILLGGDISCTIFLDPDGRTKIVEAQR